MNNILLDELPTEFEGYPINTSFRIGVQISLIHTDRDLASIEKTALVKQLLFGDEDGDIANMPDNETFTRCYEWFMTGWFHDKNVASEETRRLMDFDVDQYRIYADFLSIYGIDLNTAELHWWAFQGLLWNLPAERSAFLQAIEIRTKKPRKGASPEERKAIEHGHKIYDLDQAPAELSREEINKIDAYDRLFGK